jgi:hypothetical protein
MMLSCEADYAFVFRTATWREVYPNLDGSAPAVPVKQHGLSPPSSPIPAEVSRHSGESADQNKG